MSCEGTPGAACTRSPYMRSWSSLCGGRCPAVRNEAIWGRVARPLVPGGRTSWKPPKSLVPYGWTGTAAPAPAGASSAHTASASPAFHALRTSPPRSTARRGNLVRRRARARRLALEIELGAHPHLVQAVVGGLGGRRAGHGRREAGGGGHRPLAVEVEGHGTERG